MMRRVEKGCRKFGELIRVVQREPLRQISDRLAKLGQHNGDKKTEHQHCQKADPDLVRPAESPFGIRVNRNEIPSYWIARIFSHETTPCIGMGSGREGPQIEKRRAACPDGKDVWRALFSGTSRDHPHQ
jgi:hypothetical protein